MTRGSNIFKAPFITNFFFPDRGRFRISIAIHQVDTWYDHKSIVTIVLSLINWTYTQSKTQSWYSKSSQVFWNGGSNWPQ